MGRMRGAGRWDRRARNELLRGTRPYPSKRSLPTTCIFQIRGHSPLCHDVLFLLQPVEHVGRGVPRLAHVSVAAARAERLREPRLPAERGGRRASPDDREGDDGGGTACAGGWAGRRRRGRREPEPEPEPAGGRAVDAAGERVGADGADGRGDPDDGRAPERRAADDVGGRVAARAQGVREGATTRTADAGHRRTAPQPASFPASR